MTEAHAEITAEVAAMRAAILSGVDYKPAPRVRKPKPRREGPGRGANLRNRPPKYDRNRIRELFEEGMTVSEIAAETGAHRASVWKIMTDMGLQINTGKPGVKPKEMCGRGLHNMEENSRPVSGGGRYCVPCKAEQGARLYQEKKAAQ